MFCKTDTILHENSPREKYRSRGTVNDFGTCIHFGQRKLMLSEVQFLHEYYDVNEIDGIPIVIYVGAASGLHISLLSKWFPQFIFHLYDPQPFVIKETSKIKIFNTLFTDEIAQKYTNLSNRIFFISDIRTADWRKNHKNASEITSDKEKAWYLGCKTTEDDVWNDMQLQQKWVMMINPLHCLLKFRLPWPQKNQTNFNVEYLKGAIYYQPYSPHTSTETRLKPIKNQNGIYEVTTYDIRKYEEQLFYHNIYTREHKKYNHDFISSELKTDYDSNLEVFILRFLHADVTNLSNSLTKHLNYGSMDRENVITLEILRMSPFRTTNKKISERRRLWFKENKKQWKLCKKNILNRF